MPSTSSRCRRLLSSCSTASSSSLTDAARSCISTSTVIRLRTWSCRQLREAFPGASPYRYAILDRDSKFDADVIAFLKATGLKPKRTSVRAPWQNGISERWVGSCRREILDQVIPLNEAHLRRFIRDYVNYHHEDRIHDALEKDTPNRRPVEPKPTANSIVISMPRLGGLHHRYSWQQAA